MSDKPNDQPANGGQVERRDFLSMASLGLMAGGLLAGYGTFAGYAARYLYPARPAEKRWQFVALASNLSDGGSLVYTTPSGAPVNIARQGIQGGVDDFIALSSTCPHLGCKVHWEAHNDRFFCPCHNGVFSRKGEATEGPPAEAGQSLPQYELKLDGDMLFIEVPVDGLADAGEKVEERDLPAQSRTEVA